VYTVPGKNGTGNNGTGNNGTGNNDTNGKVSNKLHIIKNKGYWVWGLGLRDFSTLSL